MNDTPTPLTDELILESINSPFHAYGEICKHARALKRELASARSHHKICIDNSVDRENALRAQLAQLHEINLAGYTEAGWKRAKEIADEFNSAREQYQVAATGLLNTVCAGRDAALAELEKIKRVWPTEYEKEHEAVSRERDDALAKVERLKAMLIRSKRHWESNDEAEQWAIEVDILLSLK